jgi:predicted permease
MDVIARVIPFFLLIAVGVVVARARLVDLTGARALSTYVFWVGFPALLVHSLATMPVPGGRLALGLAVYALAACLPVVAAPLVGRARGWERTTRGGAAMASITGNTAFLGAPLAISVFGQAASAPAAAIVAIDCTVIMALATAMLRSSAEDTPLLVAAGKTLKNPLVVAALLGTALCLLRVVLPAPIERPLAMLRATASPVGLVALGVVIGLEAGVPHREEVAAVSLAVVCKIVLMPLLVFLALGLVETPPLFRAVATLLAACPSAVSVFIQTRVWHAFPRGGALSVVISTVTAAITLTVLAGVLGA